MGSRLLRTVTPLWRAIAGLFGTVVVVVAVAFWPSLALIALAVGALLIFAQRRPEVAFVAAIGAFLMEGTLKILLAHSGLSFDEAAGVGAALLDLALFGTFLTLLAKRWRWDVRARWSQRTTAERLVLAAAVGWLLLSLVQGLLSPSLGSALSGLRLTHAYAALVLASAIAFWDPARRDALVTGLLWLLALLLLYACVRGVIGPAAAERSFAFARGGVVHYGGSFRAIGTLSGAVGLTTVAAPAAVFGAVLAVTSPRHRRPALFVATFGLGAQVVSLGRTPLVATVVGLGFAVMLLLVATGSRRRVAGAAVLFAGCAILLVGGAAIASLTSDTLSKRLEGLTRPGSDESMQLRFDNWSERLDEASHHPLGEGLGTVGRATEGGGQTVTTDSSYLKVLIEQGVPGLGLFLVALVGGVALVTRRVILAPDPARGVGLAALSGFVTFPVMMTTTEAVEQPGKVLAWSLLGLAVAAAWSPGPRSESAPTRAVDTIAQRFRTLRAAAGAQSGRERAAWIVVGAVLIAVVVAPSLARDSVFAARARLFVSREAPIPLSADPGPYLKTLLTDPTFLYLTPSRADSVQFTGVLQELRLVDDATPLGAVMRVESATPARAVRLLDASLQELIAASLRDLRARLGAELQVIGQSLPNEKRPEQRRALRQRRSAILALLGSRPEPIVVRARPRPPEPRRAMDRLAAALPGPFPQRPEPVALAVVLAAALLLAWLARLASRVQEWPSNGSKRGSPASGSSSPS